ncbi:GntR family transcriptional regulator [Aquibacillus kalidii]|uniref:GntR family transcriptional regulator n=1 Tax=Aquibacillus kalidii TaxID=2762597 RepID=UPI001644F9B6|nr:GntR family transcriptional regulator [Aquibacillus kalidii]
MNNSLDESKPIFQQIKEQIEDMIINQTLKEGDRVPSTNEFANHYKINPATAAKGINQLVEEGILFKRRGVGMFVTDQANRILLKKRKDTFIENYIVPLKTEARKLNISEDELREMIRGVKEE